jgi:DNA-binding transcriptional regulator YiaG
LHNVGTCGEFHTETTEETSYPEKFKNEQIQYFRKKIVKKAAEFAAYLGYILPGWETVGSRIGIRKRQVTCL